ncbi:MAG TPA: MFS transporter [Bryobacteraceae bacterium]|nr:MFS transporter [Bryobacteraceae bacterium]
MRTKLTRRILPFVSVLFILGFLDRVNLSFAAADMSRDLGFGPAVYGLGAGIFFLGYLAFEIPGARLVERRSARIWLGVMLIAWGIAATLMSAVQNVREFYVLRVLLGIAEAGFFPGIIIYLSRWFPRADRARAVGALAVGLPAANILGGPVSGWLLNQTWLAIPGWRWLFFIEGLPSVLAGVVTILYLKDRPRDAHWLTIPEKNWLEAKLASEQMPAAGEAGSLFDFRFILLVIIWFLDNIGVYGLNFWLPMIVKKLSGYSVAAVATLSAAPFVGALASAAYVSASSDRRGERRWHTGVPMMVFGVGLGASVIAGGDLWLSLAALCIAALGLTAGTPGFWALATGSTRGADSTRVGIITSAGALGGFSGPYLMGYLRESAGGFEPGLALLAGCVFTAGALVIWGFRESQAGG